MAKPLLIVVDDEPDMADIVGYVADSVGYEERIVGSASEFQDVWAETTPSAIVIDIVMPKVDGIQLLEWLAQQDCTASVILMSGYDVDFLNIAEKVGESIGKVIFGTLAKPFKNDELKAMLEAILEVPVNPI